MNTSAMVTPGGGPAADLVEYCQYLPWDSNHFGLRIGRVKSARPEESSMADISRWASDQSIDCLYLLADPDPRTLRVVAGAGFRFVDVRATLEFGLSEHPMQELAQEVRPATTDDVPNLRRIAGESHRDSRFYADGNLPRALCDELYRIWIERSCVDPAFASEVLVAERNSRAVGYVSYLLSSAEAEIGLVGIDRDFRGQGIGGQLLSETLRRIGAGGGRRVRVVTQGSNVPAQRLYQSLGFRTSSIGLWYHGWRGNGLAGDSRDVSI